MAGEEQEPRVIRKDYTGRPALDYNFLRKKGIELIRQFSGDDWTDFNIHDPGVTILEALCFAITDLAYRAGFPVTDLLADEKGIINKEAHSFIPRDQILSSAPVSISDFRKLVLDIVPEVANLWLEPLLSSFSSLHVKGLYRVIIQMDFGLQQGNENEEKRKAAETDVIRKVKLTLADHRNIGEDFAEFVILQPQNIQVSGQLVISRNTIPEELLAQVYFRIGQVLNPHTLFFAEQELTAKGLAAEDIYQGPLLSHGIIPDTELKEIRSEIDKADIIKAIAGMKDVVHIRSLQIRNAEATAYTDEPVVIQQHHYPVLHFDPSFPDISLYYGNLPVPVKASVFYSMLQRLQDTYHKEFIADVHKANAQQKAEGVYRDVQEYTSVQNFFPALYRIGYDDIEDNASPRRKAEAKQLKAYLLFFEQLLAGYASQLANLEELFSPRLDPGAAHTYFFQPLYSVPHPAPLLKAFTDGKYQSWQAFTTDKQNAYIQGLQELTESDEMYRERKNNVFDHLLSRFNIVPDKYPVLLFNQLYKPETEDKRIDEELVWKSALLSQVQPFTYYRIKADNYHADNSSERQFGFAFNMRLLLHIQNEQTKLTDAVSAYINQPGKKKQPPADDAHHSTSTVRYNEEELTVADRNTDADLSSAFHFPHRSVQFFEWGINRNNYRMVPGEDTQTHQVLYKNPQEQVWNIVRQYPDRKTAQAGVQEWIKALTEASLQSEGFYIVEHLLLAPPADANVFGFTFHGRSGQPLLHQAQRVSFRQREEIIENIVNIVASANEDHAIENLQQLSGLCTIAIPGDKTSARFADPSALQSYTEEELSQLWIRLKNDLSFFATRHTEYYPRFRYSLMHWDGSIMDESFYDNQVTIVFPSWPVRFQHDGFRRFTETLFRSHLPVHQEVNFLWLNITKMLRFEDMFFNWKNALRSNNANARRMEEILFVPFLQHEINRDEK